MRRGLPKNSVSYDYESVLRQFITALEGAQGANLASVYVTGSYARGEAGDSSDLDVFCIFRSIDGEVLTAVGEAVRSVDIPYSQLEINPNCFTLSDMSDPAYAHWIEAPLRAVDGALVYGENLFSDIKPQEITLIYRRYLVDALTSVRHYINVQEPVEQFTYDKARRYILKPLLLAMRFERFCRTNSYPMTARDLYRAYSLDKENEEAARIVMYWLDGETFVRDCHIGRLLRIEGEIVRLLNT